MADYKNKELTVDILAKSFADNRSVDYIIKHDGKRIERIKNMMRYSFEVCYMSDTFFCQMIRRVALSLVCPIRRKPLSNPYC
ncbi:MAG: hypothetical protein ACR2KZ_03785 [Segetibacter sp.]